jgi:hypothetical protein
MRSAERRQEVIKSDFVRDVDCGDLCAPPVFICVEQVVITYCEVEKMTGSNTGRVVIVIFGSSRRNFD